MPALAAKGSSMRTEAGAGGRRIKRRVHDGVCGERIRAGHSAGYDLDAESLSHAEDWLRKALDSKSQHEPDLRAVVIYALALNSASSRYVQRAWEAPGLHEYEGLSMLGLALQATATRERRKSRQGEAMATVSDLEAHWRDLRLLHGV